jgi:hypothetical protein
MSEDERPMENEEREEREPTESDEQPALDDSAPEGRTEPRRRHRKWPWILGAVILSPVLLLTLWTLAVLNFSYSHGDRAGYVQKFSKKGWLCKTWEGELAMVNIPGAMQQQWEFTVRDDSVAQVITNSMGKRVSLSYNEHRGVPTSCFGETQYYVTGIRVIGD